MREARSSQRHSIFRLPLLAAFLLTLLLPAPARSQASPFGDNDFTSPKFGTYVEWSSVWLIDRTESVIEQRRDLIGLETEDRRSAVVIELHSQRSYRTAERVLATALERYSVLSGFEQFDENLDAYPPSTSFRWGEDDDGYAGYVQAHAIERAWLIAVVIGLPDALADVRELANETISVNGAPLLAAAPICGEAGAGSSVASPDSSSDGKASDFDGATPISAPAACVELFVPEQTGGDPAPTPTAAAGGRGGDFDSETYTSPSFPTVSLQYSPSSWTVEEITPAENNDGRDLIFLSHNRLGAIVYAEIFAGHNGSAAACIDPALREAGISPGADQVLTDESGESIRGSRRGQVWAAYAFTLTIENSDVSVGGYVECRALRRGAGVLVVTMIARIEDFNEAYVDLQPILASIALG